MRTPTRFLDFIRDRIGTERFDAIAGDYARQLRREKRERERARLGDDEWRRRKRDSKRRSDARRRA